MNRIFKALIFCSLIMTSVISYANIEQDTISLSSAIKKGMLNNQPSSKDSIDLDKYEVNLIISISEHYYKALYFQEYLQMIENAQKLFQKQASNSSGKSDINRLFYQSIDVDLSVLRIDAEKDFALACEQLRVLIGARKPIEAIVASQNECYFELDNCLIANDTFIKEMKIEYNHQVSKVRLMKINQQLALNNFCNQFSSRKLKLEELAFSIDRYLEIQQEFLKEYFKLRMLYVKLLPSMVEK